MAGQGLCRGPAVSESGTRILTRLESFKYINLTFSRRRPASLPHTSVQKTLWPGGGGLPLAMAA